MYNIVSTAFSALNKGNSPPAPYEILRFMMNNHLIGWPEQYFVRMREYELGLNYVESCYAIIKQHMAIISNAEFERWDQDLIYFRLNMLDYLNEWREYIEVFENARLEKTYCLTYSRPIKAIENDEDYRFNTFVLRQEDGNQYVHFLYLVSHRYEVIKRKREREICGKTTDHLKRHQRNRLTKREQDERIARFIVWFVEGMDDLMKREYLR